MKAKKQSMPQRIAAFIGADPFNALFVHEAIERYAAHVMTLKPEDHERALVSLNLIQEIAQDWRNTSE
jgi:hypothetical protein